MPIPKLWWLDDTDRYDASLRFAGAREQLAKWEWVRFFEDAYRKDDDTLEQARKKAKKALLTQLGIPPMFKQGKVVYCYGIPSFQSELAKELEISDKCLFVIIAKPDKSTALYKGACKMKLAKLDECEPIKAGQAASWIVKRAADLGMKMDPAAASLMIDMVGYSGSIFDPVIDPNKMHMELLKVQSIIPGDAVAPWAVEQAVHGSGDASLKGLCNRIVAGDRAGAHRCLGRMLANGEAPLGIVGFLADWIRRLAILEGSKAEGERAKAISRMRKRGDELEERRDEDGEVVNKRFEPVPMYSNAWAFGHSFKDLASMSGMRNGWWSEWVLDAMADVDIYLRLKSEAWEGPDKVYMPDDDGRQLVNFVDLIVREVALGQRKRDRDNH